MTDVTIRNNPDRERFEVLVAAGDTAAISPAHLEFLNDAVAPRARA